MAEPAAPPEAVLLDVDDTLVDTRAAFRAGLGQVLRSWLPHLDGEGRERALRHWVRDPGGHFRAFTRGELTFGEQRRLRGADLHATFGGPALDAEGHARWEAGYETAFRAAWRAVHDAAGLLDALDAAGVRYGALTNMAGEYQREKLAAVGLGRVRVLVSMDDLGRGKPDPAVFRLACERLGSEPARTAYVGDDLDVDARGARDAGLIGVWLDRHGTGLSPSDVLVARGLAEVPGLLGLLGDPAAGGTGFGARPPGGYSSASGHGAPAERP